MALIKAAKSKKKIVRNFLFDGTEVEPATLVNSIIGVQKTYLGGLPQLDKTAYWPIRMAFFSVEKQLEPEYEISIKLHDNGVVSGLILDYGDLIIDVELMEIEYLRREPAIEVYFFKELFRVKAPSFTNGICSNLFSNLIDSFL